jgi:hypothetical protein
MNISRRGMKANQSDETRIFRNRWRHVWGEPSRSTSVLLHCTCYARVSQQNIKSNSSIRQHAVTPLMLFISGPDFASSSWRGNPRNDLREKRRKNFLLVVPPASSHSPAARSNLLHYNYELTTRKDSVLARFQLTLCWLMPACVSRKATTTTTRISCVNLCYVKTSHSRI